MDIETKGGETHAPFSGYYSNTVPEHDPLLTETGPGTTCGEYMRRFWHPICLSLELTDTPRYVKLFDEELVVIRDKSGDIGIFHAHCCHRGASLEYGHIQEHGIACSYHGWKFDNDGRCTEVPAPKGEEEEGARFAAAQWQGAYKGFERSGLVFVYMGPPEEEPLFPDFEDGFTVGPDDELVAFSNHQHCNWLQVQDNSSDQYHHIPLHTTAVIPGHEQGTTFGEAGAGAYMIRPDLQFFPVHDGKSMAWTSSRRVDKDKLFIRINQQMLPDISIHSYLFETGEARKLFSRMHMIRWTVPIDDVNSKMIGWRVVGPNIDPRGIGEARRHMIGYETIDFLDGQVAMRRPERFGKYKHDPMPPIPPNHRERSCYKDAQYAPGDYEVIISQRDIAVHALENPMKADGGVYLFRKLLRDAITGDNKKASPEAFKKWMEELDGHPPSYCSGNILEVPEAATQEEEVERRRVVATQIIEGITESNQFTGDERTKFIHERLGKIETDNS